MVKAKDFWKYLCEELNYRFFAGTACPGLNPLYKKMDIKVMHYVPASNERIALGLVSGAYMSGLKGGLLIDMRFAYDITESLKFNIDYRVPLLVIGHSSGDNDESLSYDFPSVIIDNDSFKKKIYSVAAKSESDSVPGLIVVKKEVLL